MPRVSILMGVYNGARYLETALESILTQSFSDYEFIIVDDGSTDETPAILVHFGDPRIVLLRNEANLGLTKSLNLGLGVTRGEYVARQDADDVSLCHRLARQVRFLDDHPEISLVGTSFVQIDEQGYELGTTKMPTEPDQIREMLFYTHCFCHGSVMGRRADLQAVGGYDERFGTAQDMDLWLRLAERYQLANLAEPLYGFRMHTASVTGRSRSVQKQMGHQAASEAMSRCLKYSDAWRPSARTLGRYHLGQAMHETEDGSIDRAREQVSLAHRGNPHLDDDADYLALMVVQRAFEQGPAGMARRKSKQDVQSGLQFADTLFGLLPRELRALRARRRWVLAELHAAYAFAASKRAEPGATALHCMRAWCHEPSRLANRGLLSVFTRSLVGARPERQGERNHS